MNTEIEDFSGLKVEVEKYDNATIEGGNEAFIIYLKLHNLTDSTKKIKLLKTTYITNKREQLEQDDWLFGYLIGESSLKPNSYQKAGLIFYKTKLKQLSENDLLYVSIELASEGKELTLCLKKNYNNWEIIDKELKEIEVQLSPKQLEKNLLKKIERFEAFEERLGVYFENLTIKNNDNTSITVFCELHSTSGTSINNTLYVECVLYDLEGYILDKKDIRISKDNFYGFELIKIKFFEVIVNNINKIRLYPKLS